MDREGNDIRIERRFNLGGFNSVLVSCSTTTDESKESREKTIDDALDFLDMLESRARDRGHKESKTTVTVDPKDTTDYDKTITTNEPEPSIYEQVGGEVVGGEKPARKNLKPNTVEPQPVTGKLDNKGRMWYVFLISGMVITSIKPAG